MQLPPIRVKMSTEQVSRKLLHDLRNPLAAIYTAVAMVEELPPETPLSSVRRHLSIIQQALEQSRTLIDGAQLQFDQERDLGESKQC